ncbi:MAG TPA: MBL fold metallo-hydrolase, partial [Bacillota bacterium]|nr:MBL fold metallo-hydrolase [Bacillota bacterium]
MELSLDVITTITIPTPFPVGPVNLYLIKSDPVTLIDAGPYLPEADQLIEQNLKQSGLGFQDIKRRIVTHTHPDHVGLAGRLQELTDARLYLHTHEAAKLKQRSMDAYERVGILEQAGIPPEVVEEISRWNMKTRQQFTIPIDLDSVILVGGGERLEFQHFQLELIHTPGHSPGHLCLFDRQEGILFAGDHLLANISPNPVLEPDPSGLGRSKSMADYLKSVDSICKLPIKMVYPSHGEPFADYQQVVDRFYRYFRLREKTVVEAMGNSPRTAYEIARTMYPVMPGRRNSFPTARRSNIPKRGNARTCH